MTKRLPWTPDCYAGMIDPQSQVPTNSSAFKSPHRPRPPKPVQPREDGCSRMPSAKYAADLRSLDLGNSRQLHADPKPRDPGNGRYVLAAAMDVDGGSRCFGSGSNQPRPPKPPQPRDPGSRRRKGIQPRDSGF
ncbi:hypothetical protein B0A50_08751 [Salinomyces thailandicus]|uniref:Uncharacterized protein n=1 Tax=Salinomyces thailandicus TaxID=706561 RepID=A0A4U0TJL0_9PEZI|nr:hypothetical protein B0A50_08751 [Salinomyces thailandica]